MAEEGLERGGSAVGERVNGLDKGVNARGHDEEIASGFRTGIPVCVGDAARNENGGAGARLNFFVTNLNAENSFDDIPGFVVAVMHVSGSNVPRRPGRCPGVAPFGDDEVVRWRAYDVSREGWSDKGRAHGKTT